MSSFVPSASEFQDSLILKPATDCSSATPDVTVVTVCFNPLKAGRQELFSRNLESVQRQAGVTVEHLIIDGASTDGTMDFLKAFDNKHHNLRILSKTDSGLYEAMNRGIALAKGRYVAFLNSDDYYHDDDGLAVSVRTLDESGCSFSFAPILAKKPHCVSLRKPQLRLHKFFVFCVTRHPSMLFRLTDLLEIGGYDQAYRVAADYDLMLRLVAAGHKACFVNHCFVTFVEGGFAMQNEELKFKEKVEIIRKAHREAFGVEFTDEEAESLVRNCTYPRKYLRVYEKSQRLVANSFVCLPQNVLFRLVRNFNYTKYWLSCFLSFA